jgi:hypothetical protein
VTRIQAERWKDLDAIPGKGQKFYLSFKVSDHLGPTEFLIRWVLGDVFRSKAAGLQGNHSHLALSVRISGEKLDDWDMWQVWGRDVRTMVLIGEM